MTNNSMKITLISPAPDHGLSEMQSPHHGLAYIGATLLKNQYNVNVIDAKTLHLKTDEVISQVLREKPDVVGITAMTPDIICANKIAEGIKKDSPKTIIIVGGPHCTALPEKTLQEFPLFNFLIIGEGEITIIELLEALKNGNSASNFKKIEGIAFRENGKNIITQSRLFVSDLESIPFPAWGLFPQVKDYPVYASRGCPFNCVFCMRVLGSKVRVRQPENIVREIEWLVQQNKKFFWFSDETFGVKKEWLYNLLDLIIEKGLNKKINWSANSRVNLADYDTYMKMKEAGCVEINFGIESGSNEILSKVHKGFTTDMAKKAIATAKKAGFKTGAFYIIGHPYETHSTIKETINLAAELNTTEAAFGLMVPYPGTKVFELANKGEAGYLKASENWDEYRKYFGTSLEFRNFSSAELKKYQAKAYINFYIKNYRFKELFLFLYRHKRSLINFIKNKFKKLLIHSGIKDDFAKT